MTYDPIWFATDELNDKPYAKWYVQFETHEYLKTHYPHVNYTFVYNTNYFGDEGEEEE